MNKKIQIRFYLIFSAQRRRSEKCQKDIEKQIFREDSYSCLQNSCNFIQFNVTQNVQRDTQYNG